MGSWSSLRLGGAAVLIVRAHAEVTAVSDAHLIELTSDPAFAANYSSSGTGSFGSAVASLGDVNNDGVDDIAIGARYDSDGNYSAGAVYVLFMRANGTASVAQKISNSHGGLTAFFNLAGGARFGSSIAPLGDFDGDGVPDMAVGAYGDNDGAEHAGAIYLITLTVDGTVGGALKISNEHGGLSSFVTLSAYDYFGESIVAGYDFNGDGVLDLAVGAFGDDDGEDDDAGREGNGNGAVHVLFMTADHTVGGAAKISNEEGNLGYTVDDCFGSALAPLGDLDGNGVPDLAVGSRCSNGAVYILFMTNNGTVNTSQKISRTTGGLSSFASLPNDNWYRFGSSVANVGDYNNDGVTDIAVGATGDDDGYNSAGACYIVMLTTSGTVTGVQKISNSQGSFPLTIPQSAYFGKSVASLGDFNSDGVVDIVVGAYGSPSAAVYTIFLAAPPTPVPTTSPLPTPIPTTAFPTSPSPTPSPTTPSPTLLPIPAPTSLSPTSAPVKAPGDRDDSISYPLIIILAACAIAVAYAIHALWLRRFHRRAGHAGTRTSPQSDFDTAPVITQMVEVSDASKKI